MATVLVVDDVADGRELLARVLRQLGGHDALTADGGQRALELIDSRRPELVLLDISMPGMDGFDVLEALRARSEPMPTVVMFTAFDSSSYRERAASLGAADYLVKGDADLGKLLTRVGELASRGA